MTPAARAIYLQRIRDELDNDPAERGYAGAADDAERAELLNEPYETLAPNPQGGWADCDDVRSAFNQAPIGASGLTVWDLIDAAAATSLNDNNPVTEAPWGKVVYYGLRRAHGWLTLNPYIDLTNTNVQALIAGMVAAGILTSDQAAALQGLGQPTTLATEHLPRFVQVMARVPSYAPGEEPIWTEPGPPNVCSVDDVTAALALE